MLGAAAVGSNSTIVPTTTPNAHNTTSSCNGNCGSSSSLGVQITAASPLLNLTERMLLLPMTGMLLLLLLYTEIWAPYKVRWQK